MAHVPLRCDPFIPKTVVRDAPFRASQDLRLARRTATLSHRVAVNATTLNYPSVSQAPAVIITTGNVATRFTLYGSAVGGSATDEAEFCIPWHVTDGQAGVGVVLRAVAIWQTTI